MARVVLVTPSSAEANNGNARTAQRWAGLLRPRHRVTVTTAWDGGPADLMVALHARRSAASIAAWAQALPRRPLAVVLTGTDLNGDLPAGDPVAWRSVSVADRIVVLHDRAVGRLPPALRPRAHVVVPSCGARRDAAKPVGHLRVVVVGHLRDEKSPRTVFEVVRRLADRPDIRIDLVGRALDPALGDAARRLAGTHPAWRWLEARPHDEARRRIQRAHLLWNPSRSEGAPTVVVEALRSGTPVLASAIDGHLGLLGDDWPALHAVDDVDAAVDWLRRLRDEPDRLAHLAALARDRSGRFDPALEQVALQALVDGLLAGGHARDGDPATIAAPGAADTARPPQETAP